MWKPTAVPAATLAVVLALVISTSAGSSNGSAGASQTSTTTSASTAARGGSQPSAAAWCAMVIDINTRGGMMANKQYLQSGLTPAKLKAVSQEAVNRRKEFLAITPSEIKDAMTHELDYFAAALKDPAAGMGNFTPADVQALSSFQKTKCGIGGL